jgi:hypothetical protein
MRVGHREESKHAQHRSLSHIANLQSALSSRTFRRGKAKKQEQG